MPDDDNLVLVGAGGHSVVVRSVLRSLGWPVAGVLDDRDSLLTTSDGVPVLGKVNKLHRYQASPIFIAIGCNETRMEISTKIRYVSPPIIHPTAWVDESATVGEGSVIMANAVVQPNAIIGRHVIINSGTVVEHDCHVGDFAHLAPGVRLAGGVKIGNGVLMGIGSVAVPFVNVARWSVVGAGAVLIEDVSEGDRVAGVPAESLLDRVPRALQ